MKISAKKAISNHCKGCIYDPLAGGNWLQQVEDCKITKCELYEHRPLTRKTRVKNMESYLAMLSEVDRAVALEKLEKRRENASKIRLYRNT